MIKILTIIGARPQIIKAAALSRAIRTHFPNQIEECLVHTGQHYDTLMSDVFFQEMDIPCPAYNLGIGSGAHAWQTARMMEGIAGVLETERPDGLVIYGDTNSTLAGALAASKMQVPIFHIEAGLRSFYMPMPEEQNRVVADHLASICFAPTQTAMQNLEREGLTDSPALFTTQRKHRLSILTGDVMLDNALHFAPLARQSDTLKHLNLEANHYLLATVHRDFNADSTDRMDLLLTTLTELAAETHLPVVIPAHPRVSGYLSAWTESHRGASHHLHIIPPASYLQMLALEQGAAMILTDSGGVQKEAYFCQRPCIILRHETEWKEIVDQGAAILADITPTAIHTAYHQFRTQPPVYSPLFGDGHAAERIAQEIIKYLS